MEFSKLAERHGLDEIDLCEQVVDGLFAMSEQDLNTLKNVMVDFLSEPVFSGLVFKLDGNFTDFFYAYFYLVKKSVGVSRLVILRDRLGLNNNCEVIVVLMGLVDLLDQTNYCVESLIDEIKYSVTDQCFS